MLAEMSASQFAEWRAFFSLEPWGAIRDDLRAGSICAAITNNRGMVSPPRRSSRPSDFFRSLEPAARSRPTGAELAGKLKAAALATGGRVEG